MINFFCNNKSYFTLNCGGLRPLAYYLKTRTKKMTQKHHNSQSKIEKHNHNKAMQVDLLECGAGEVAGQLFKSSWRCVFLEPR